MIKLRSNKFVAKWFNKTKISGLSWSLIRGILLSGICFIILYPMLIQISSSIMELDDMFNPSVQWVPMNITFENYRIAFEWMDYPKTLANTLFFILSVSLLQLFSCTIVGYGFGRFSFKGINFLFGLVILTLVIPPQMIMIPLFLNFRFFSMFGLLGEGINLIGSYWPFILTSATAMGLKNGLFIYITRKYFKGMPDSLEEAAYVDGAGSFKTFYKIMLPGAIPVMVIIFLFAFVWQWNDIFYLNLYIRGGSDFLAYALQGFAANYLQYIRGTGQWEPDQLVSLLNNAGMVLFITPLLLLFSFMQRYFIESVERSGIVG